MVRNYFLPITHGIMMVFNFVTNNSRINLDGLKKFFSFGGMFLIIVLLAQVTSVMFYFESPINWNMPEADAATFLWFEVEWLVFIGTLLSNIIFIALRTQIRDKFQLD
jgi:hypothetical protein